MSFSRDPEHVDALAKSLEIVGPLTEVLLDPDNEKLTLSGRHRQFASGSWPARKAPTDHVYAYLMKIFPGISEKMKKDLARELIIAHGNVQRMVPEKETSDRFKRIAQIVELLGIEKEHICSVLVKILPYGERHIQTLLPHEYKRSSGYTNRTSAVGTVNPTQLSKKAEEVKGALTGLNKHGLEPTYPFPGCKCKECDNRALCGY